MPDGDFSSPEAKNAVPAVCAINSGRFCGRGFAIRRYRHYIICAPRKKQGTGTPDAGQIQPKGSAKMKQKNTALVIIIVAIVAAAAGAVGYHFYKESRKGPIEQGFDKTVKGGKKLGKNVEKGVKDLVK